MGVVHIVLFFLACFLGLFSSKTVTISNIVPRYDNQNKIMDAHDGPIQKFEGLYYIHAAQYGLCKEPAVHGCDQTADHCGFQPNHNISIYSSPDMSSGSWKFEGYAINWKDRPAGVLFRPHLVYNPNTREYVLWWNYSNEGKNLYAVATSKTPVGPFVIRNTLVNVTRGLTSGDFDLFVDDDGTGYIVYSANFWISVEKLTPDFLYSTGQNASCGPNNSPLFPDYFVEAPIFFKRNEFYYILFGHCCCYCYQGSGILVYMATSPLGPWKRQPGGDIACRPPPAMELNSTIPTPGQGCLYNSDQISVTRSQQNFVVKVPTTSGVEYIWTGDRWQQSPDQLKGHDPQYWTPLHFNPDNTIAPVTWIDEFTFDLIE